MSAKGPEKPANPRLSVLRILVEAEQSPVRLEKLISGNLSRSGGLEGRDRAMATRLVYAVLRHKLRLEHALDRLLQRPLAGLDPLVRHILLMGAAELLILQTPAHAAVFQAVELAKSGPARRGQGLINAVLKRLAREGEGDPPPWEGMDGAARLSVQYSHPRWLVEELLPRWGRETLEPWLAADQHEPPLTLRVNTLKTTPGEVAALLAERVGETRPHPLSPEGLILSGVSGPSMDLPGFREGLWQIQDGAAQAVTRLLGAEPGMRVLDLCAGAGGKTGHLAALMENRGQLTALDSSPGRIRALKENLARLGVANAAVVRADGREYKPRGASFHRVLVDAPCSGLGVAGRRPDVRWRKGPEDPARLAVLQGELLFRAADLLVPGGALVYCTCTVTRAENEAVVERVLAMRPELALDREWSLGPAAPAPEPEGWFRTFPHLHLSDAFFAARLVKAPASK